MVTPPPLITLTTDFGTESHYVAQVKGAILNLAGDAQIIDISHSVPPQDVETAAWVLNAALLPFPPRAIHVVVVDPGVGSERAVLAVQTNLGFFVAPDNGVLTRVWHRSDQRRAVRLNEPTLWRIEVSNTFHGRDIMGPVAAHLARGGTLLEMGTPAAEIHQLTLPRPRTEDGAVVGRIDYIDSFGNCIANITMPDLVHAFGRDASCRGQLRVALAGRDVIGVRRCYADVVDGQLVALFGSGGQLEVALAGGHAAGLLSTQIGDAIVVSVNS